MKEKIKAFGMKVKEFYEEHKAKIWFAAGFTVAMAVGHDIFFKKPIPSKGYGFCDEIDGPEPSDYPALWEDICSVDEDIFTSLAPEIEDALFEEGLDEARIDRSYTIRFPKGGDSENDFYKTVKNVMVLVQDTCE